MYKDALVFAFPTYIPLTPSHMLICPIRCVRTIGKLTDKELLALFALREKITAALRHSFGARGFNYAWNEDKVAGQDIPHLHLHVVPRKAGDTGITRYKPCSFLYRPGPRAPSPEEELRRVSELVRHSLLLN